jgi:hypothetical protein
MYTFNEDFMMIFSYFIKLLFPVLYGHKLFKCRLITISHRYSQSGNEHASNSGNYDLL